MPESLIIRVLRGVFSVLIAIGTPPLFAIKILVWTTIWFGNSSLKIIHGFIELIVGVGETAVWLIRTLIFALISLVDLAFGKVKYSSLSFQRMLESIKINLYRFRVKPGMTSLKKIRLSFPPFPHFPRLPETPTLPSFPKYQPTSFLEKLSYLFLGSLICFLVFFIPYWVSESVAKLPNPKALSARDIPVSTKIYDRNKILLYQIYNDENRSIVLLNDLPRNLINATIAIEDNQFYQHIGIDPKGIVRAVIANYKGEDTQGGSTLTQQLIKSALLSPERTVSRKIKEIILAFWAERIYSKNQILEMYFNQIPYGGSAYGIETASQVYFGKHAKDLDLAQSAFLAGLPAAPSIYSPFGTHPELAKQRQLQVLQAMEHQKFITAGESVKAFAQNLQFNSLQSEIKAPHFVMYVKDYLTHKYGSRVVERGGLEVITSLDYPTYEMVSKLLADGVARQGYLHVGNGAVLVTNPKTGEILAMVGSTDYFNLEKEGNVNVTIANRSPGSSIKPLVYAQAFEKNLINSSTIIDDSPTIYKIAGSSPYAPQNYDNKFHGKVTVRTALGSSYNIPAVKVIDKIGVKNFIDFAKVLGITTFINPERYGLSLSLGGGEVKMEDMAVAFSIFANNGDRVPLKPVLLATDYSDKVLEDNRDKDFGKKIISSKTAFLISNILADDAARAPTFGPGSYLNIPGHTVAVKTGTAQDKRDNWTIGFTPTILVSVWVGNNDNSPMSPYLESGRTGAAAIWNPIMAYLLRDKPNEPITRPDDVVPVQICALNGLLTCQYCPYVVTEYFNKGEEPKTACNFTKDDLERMKKDKEDRDKKDHDKKQ